MLYQQKEIHRLRQNTKKIWEKLDKEKQEKSEPKVGTPVEANERSTSEASSVCNRGMLIGQSVFATH